MEAILKNIMEELVINKYDEIYETLNCCHCKVCRLDIIAQTLNSLPTKYIVSEKGALFAKLNAHSSQSETNILTELTRASELVNKYPRH